MSGAHGLSAASLPSSLLPQRRKLNFSVTAPTKLLIFFFESQPGFVIILFLIRCRIQ